MARTAWFRRNPYDSAVLRGQDAELWCRTFRQGVLTRENVIGLDEPLYFCREESGIAIGKVLAAHAGLRRLIRAHGPAALGTWGARFELFRSYLRSMTLKGFAGVGLLTHLTSHARNQPILDPVLRQRVQTEVDLVCSTAVPGLD